MFEKAVRMKLRWPFRGQCSAEDLWDLTALQLDAIYKALSRDVKMQNEESLLDERSEADEVLNLQIGIVRRVFEVKKAEQDARKNATLRKARKEKLLDVMARKQDAQLEDMPLEDLQKMIDEIE